MAAIWNFIRSKATRAIAAFVVAALGLYGAFVYERKPALTIEVLSSSSVLDVRERLTKLAIIFDGTDLRATSQSLHLLVLRFRNSGSADIHKTGFDEQAPLGFQVTNGRIVEQPSISADSYLSSRLSPRVLNERTVTFAPVILNAGDYFDVRVLLLVPQDTQPMIQALGKVVGVKKITVSSGRAGDTIEDRYLVRAFSGNWAIQVIRVTGYTLGFFLSILILTFVVALPISAIVDFFKKHRRVAKVKLYREAIGRRLSLKEEYLATQYQDGTWHYDAFARIVRGETTKGTIHYYMRNGRMHDEVRARAAPDLFRRASDDLVANGLIVRDGPEVRVSEDFIEAAKSFVSFVTDSADSNQTKHPIAAN